MALGDPFLLVRSLCMPVFMETATDIATCMSHTGIDPFTGRVVVVNKWLRDRKAQRAVMQFFKPENYFMVGEALIVAGRQDLIGCGCDALIPSSPPPEALEARRGQRGAGRQQRPHGSANEAGQGISAGTCDGAGSDRALGPSFSFDAHEEFPGLRDDAQPMFFLEVIEMPVNSVSNRLQFLTGGSLQEQGIELACTFVDVMPQPILLAVPRQCLSSNHVASSGTILEFVPMETHWHPPRPMT